LDFTKLIQSTQVWLPAIAIFVIGIVLIIPLKKLILKKNDLDTKSSQWTRQLILLSITSIFLLLFLISLPIDKETKGQLFNLLGIAITATIALSSTTFVGNAMAGLMLKAIDGFKLGDFLKIDKHYGRVSERGLFHVEIQTEENLLVTLPNLYLVTNPLTVARSSGTVVSATVSLGYDIPRTEVEALLIKAGEKTGLKDPFVHILELGDFSVTYRLSGILTNVKYLISYHSDIKAQMLDVLHENGVEIVSPNFMNQRMYPLDQPFIPKTIKKSKVKDAGKSPEDVIFDKADEAQSVERIKEIIQNSLDEIEILEKEPENDNQKIRVEKLNARVEKLKALMEEKIKDIEESKD
jgi:small-conductance mechanosensitive channel